MKTTKKHFKLFKNECQKWIDKFELNNWSVAYSWKNLDEDNLDGASNYGTTTYDAYISLDTDIEDIHIDGKNIIKLIKECAKHEIIHLLIKRLKLKAIDRYIKSEDEIVEIEEELVQKLEKIIR